MSDPNNINNNPESTPFTSDFDSLAASPSFEEHLKQTAESERQIRDQDYRERYIRPFAEKLAALDTDPSISPSSLEAYRGKLEAEKQRAAFQAEMNLDCLHTIEDFSQEKFDALSSTAHTPLGDQYRRLAQAELENAKKAILNLEGSYHTRGEMAYFKNANPEGLDRLGRPIKDNFGAALYHARNLSICGDVADRGFNPQDDAFYEEVSKGIDANSTFTFE